MCTFSFHLNVSSSVSFNRERASALLGTHEKKQNEEIIKRNNECLNKQEMKRKKRRAQKLYT